MTDLDPQPDAAPPSSAGRDAERTRAHRRRNLRVLGVLVVALGLLLGGAWQLVLPLFSDSSGTVTDYPGPGTGEVDVLIDDADPSAIATTLVDADVVATTTAFVEAYEANPSARSILPGTYALSRQMTAADAVVALLDPANRADRTITIPAGWRQAQIESRIAEVMGVPADEVADAVADVELPDGAPDPLVEGWLAAGSYSIAPTATPTDVVQQMLDRTVEILDARDVDPKDRDRVLVEASIVEAEVTGAEDRGRVARVMDNRLAGCADVGEYLQMNSTVAYGLGKSVIDLTLADLEDDSTRYNTYAFEGLPPTPISSPSEESIDAVLDPPAGSWCYFVTVNLETGETRFTDDPEVHEENRAEYRAWREQWLADQSAGPTDDATDEG